MARLLLERRFWSPRFSRRFHDWELEEVQAFFGRLSAHHLSLETNDVMVWLPTKDDTFSVKSFYSSLANRRLESFPYGILWNCWVPTIFACEATRARILTLDQLKRRG